MIKNAVKNISNLVATLYSLDSLINKTNHRLILPFYHVVSDGEPVHIKNLYTPRSVKSFINDLDFLLENYKSISLQELISISKGEKTRDEKYFHLTFDDGLKEFYTIVAPILKEKAIHATVFLNSDFIDNKQLFFRFKASILCNKLKNDEVLNLSFKEEHVLDSLAKENGINFNEYLEKEQPYLNSGQIKELISDGFTFGAHSKNHPLYKELIFEEQIIQTKESINVVTSRFNLAYKVFSFPFTDDGVSQQFFNEIKSDVDITFGCAGIKEDAVKNNLQRIPMETAKSGKQIIKTEYLYCLIKQKIGKNKVLRK